MFDVASIADRLRCRDDGIWYGAEQEQVSYPAAGHQVCFQLEESSFWFRHRNACIAAAVTNFPPLAGGPILDIGGGNGFVTLGLRKAGFDAVLMEPGVDGARNAKQRGIPTVICATTASAGIKTGKLNGVGLFDVIEHIEAAPSFLASLRPLMAEGARLYATVPAYSLLWSREDETAGHFRRYRLSAIARELETARFAIEYATYFFRPLPLPIFLLRALPYRLGLTQRVNRHRDATRDHRPPTAQIGQLLDQLLKPELANIRAQRSMGFGGSCLVVARAIR
jgi:2-polyprenyl-3-methyl-5-hydroxy-6-metoxy-1,4-benzoquinol methylase